MNCSPFTAGCTHNILYCFVPSLYITVLKSIYVIFSQILLHVERDCPLTMISCPYAEMGCTSKVMGHFREWHLFVLLKHQNNHFLWCPSDLLVLLSLKPHEDVFVDTISMFSCVRKKVWKVQLSSLTSFFCSKILNMFIVVGFKEAVSCASGWALWGPTASKEIESWSSGFLADDLAQFHASLFLCFVMPFYHIQGDYTRITWRLEKSVITIKINLSDEILKKSLGVYAGQLIPC